ncbi:9370_t:CDS:2, partial [Scutellospora calospora]
RDAILPYKVQALNPAIPFPDKSKLQENLLCRVEVLLGKSLEPKKKPENILRSLNNAKRTDMTRSSPSREGPFYIHDIFSHGVYKLRALDDK